MTNATVKLFLDGREIKNSVADIEKEMKKLRKTQRDLVIGSEEYNRTGKQIQELNGILATHRASIRNTGKEYLTLSQRLGKVADGFNRYMGVVAGAIGAVTGQLPADGEGYRDQVHPLPFSRRAYRNCSRCERIASGNILRLSVHQRC